MKLSNNKILITGGATGIGLGLTERFLKEGNTVIICGRREDVLTIVRKRHPEVITRVCDLEVETERILLINWLRESHPDTNVIVNNAGIQNWMNVDQEDFYRKTLKEIDINAIAPLHLSLLAFKLPALETIMFVTSGLALVPTAKAPVYCATKAFLHSFTLSLRYMLKDKFEVIEIVPAALNTDLGGKGIHDSFPSVSEFIETIFEELKAGKEQVSYGFSNEILAASPDKLNEFFKQYNP